MLKEIRHIRRRWLEPIFTLKHLRQSVTAYLKYLADWKQYSSLPGAEGLRVLESHPRLFDRTPTTEYDPHYLYQDVWALKLIHSSNVTSHVDVGSRAIFVAMLTAFTDVTFIDIRPLVLELNRLHSFAGSILAMPFKNESVQSLSCLHVAEHIGLGRYGDPLDPAGTRKAAAEISRVLAPEGNLYFSVPVGRSRVCFNAHRVHTPEQIVSYFDKLELVKFSGVDDEGVFKEGIELTALNEAEYACGLFHFRRGSSVMSHK